MGMWGRRGGVAVGGVGGWWRDRELAEGVGWWVGGGRSGMYIGRVVVGGGGWRVEA